MKGFRTTFVAMASMLALCIPVVGGPAQSVLDDTAVPPKGIDGIACVGQVPGSNALPGFVGTNDFALLTQALRPSGAGFICAGQVFALVADYRIYRLWDHRHPEWKMSEWWALEPPRGSREDYRADYVVCREWTLLDRLVMCTLKAGAKVVVGPGQSANCAEGASYEKSSVLQVYIPLPVEQVTKDCSEEPWP